MYSFKLFVASLALASSSDSFGETLTGLKMIKELTGVELTEDEMNPFALRSQLPPGVAFVVYALESGDPRVQAALVSLDDDTKAEIKSFVKSVVKLMPESLAWIKDDGLRAKVISAIGKLNVEVLITEGPKLAEPGANVPGLLNGITGVEVLTPWITTSKVLADWEILGVALKAVRNVVIRFKKRHGRLPTVHEAFEGFNNLPTENKKVLKLLFHGIQPLLKLLLSVMKDGPLKTKLQQVLDRLVVSMTEKFPFLRADRGSLVFLWVGLAVLVVAAVGVGIYFTVRRSPSAGLVIL